MSKQEFLAVADENGNIIPDKKILRTLAHKNGILHAASHIFIYRKKNGKTEILLQRRSHNKDSYPDCLDISSAGHVEFGMDFLDTALKELNEELGITVHANELKEIFTQRFSAVDKFHGKLFNNQEINKVYILEKDIHISDLTLQNEEISDVIWLDSELILKNISEHNPEYCLDIDEYKKVLSEIKK